MEYVDLSDFTRGYVDAIFFTENEDTLKDKGFKIFAPEALTRIIEDCTSFELSNVKLLDAAYSMNEYFTPASAGHDFWLTRNHHGAGFWDRDLGAIGDALTQKCQAFKEVYIYIGDDGRIYHD